MEKRFLSSTHTFTDAYPGSCVAPDAVLFDFFRLPDAETGRSPAADHTKVHSHWLHLPLSYYLKQVSLAKTKQ